jgi:hypothetical protein
MAVRKIPKNHLVVTGSFASRKNGQMDQFESLLEKEYLLLLDFDDSVERYETQPVTIPIPGMRNGYTPDVLVFYLSDRKPQLTEIKHTDDLRRNAEKYAPKFTAAEQYALELNWEFRVVTQIDIRTPRLSNLKFLREYRNIEPAAQDCAEIVRLMKKADEIFSPKTLLDQLATSDDDRLYWLPVIWHSIVTRKITADLDRPIDNNAALHLPQSIL